MTRIETCLVVAGIFGVCAALFMGVPSPHARADMSNLPNGGQTFDLTSTACTNAWTIVGTPGLSEIASVHSGSIVAVQVCNTDADATVTNFRVQTKAHFDGDWETYYEGTDFDTATSTVPRISATGPHEIGTNGCANFDMRLYANVLFRFQAMGTNGYADVVIRGSARP